MFRLPLAAVRFRAGARFASGAVGSGAESNGGAVAGEELIRNKLVAKFAPSSCQVDDVSGGCGSFYAIHIASKAFAGLSVVKQHRLVQDELKEIISGIHGVQIKTTAE